MKKILLVLSLLLALQLISITPEDIEKADGYRLNNKYELELGELNKLAEKYPDDYEVYWRIAQSHFDIADQSDLEKVHKEHFYPGLKVAKKALQLNPKSAEANHWYAVLIGKIGMLEGTKQKIKNSYDVRKFALKAIELDPTNDGTLHLMGRWHYELASLSWVERKVAALIYAKPPNASFDKAVNFFKSAINVKQDEVRHHLWLGKTYMAMKENSKAENAFRKAINMKPLDQGDRLMQKEATKLLKKVT